MARSKKTIDEKFYAPFPTRLRKLMEERGETQENLAIIVNKSRQTVSQYCNGVSEPGYDTLIKISEFFDVSIDYLLGRTNDRGLTPSVYDAIGLSEKSISFLRLAYSARTDCTKLAELVDILCEHGIVNIKPKYPELNIEEMETVLQRCREHSAKNFAYNLAKFVDDIITIASTDKKVIKAYSQIVSPDRRPIGLEESLSESDFIRFQIYEISTAINHSLTQILEDFEVSSHGND